MTIQDHITGQPGAGQFLLEAAPDREMPELGLTPQQAQRLITEELSVDGIPARNLATFVTT